MICSFPFYLIVSIVKVGGSFVQGKVRECKDEEKQRPKSYTRGGIQKEAHVTDSVCLAIVILID